MIVAIEGLKPRLQIDFAQLKSYENRIRQYKQKTDTLKLTKKN